jgi:putrescine---pyruvate transaminase
MAVIARKYAYHGVGLASTSLTGLESCLTPFGLPLPGFLHAPAPHRYDDPDPQRRAMSREQYGQWCLEQTRKLIEATGPRKVGAIFAEPVQGAGGVIPPPPGYLAGLRNLAREYGTLFVADEVITAYGRMAAGSRRRPSATPSSPTSCAPPRASRRATCRWARSSSATPWSRR